jgi:RNA-directed DNA polymerase
MLKKLQEVKMELRKRMHDPIAKTGAWLNRMLKGLNYYAVSGNSPSLWWYFNEVRWRWLSRSNDATSVHS